MGGPQRGTYRGNCSPLFADVVNAQTPRQGKLELGVELTAQGKKEGALVRASSSLYTLRGKVVQHGKNPKRLKTE